MKYPKHFVDMFAELAALNDQGFDMLADCYDYDDPEMIELEAKSDELSDRLEEMCMHYASETGADLELDFNEEDWYGDLERQYMEDYNEY